MQCPRCQHENPPGQKFCGECGTPAIGATSARPYADLNNEIEGLRRSLTEALEQQTASAEILKAISRSTFDLQPVLDTLIENATRLCGSRRGVIMRRDGESYHGAAFYNVSADLIDFIKHHPITPGRHSITGRVALERRTIHVTDLQSDPEYRYALRDTHAIGTELGVPMFRGDDIVGVMILHKLKVEPFTDKQIELVETFADQAVIAVENVRLFNETKEALEQQTATSEILRVISSSPTDEQPVFDAIAENALRLCGASHSVVGRYDGQLLHMAAHAHVGAEGVQAMRQLFPMRPSRTITSTRAILDRTTIHLPDVLDDPEYDRPTALAMQNRATLAVPMLRDDEPIGTIFVGRPEPRAFTDKQIALLQTFADQAVIAIENVRLFTELQEKNRALTTAHAQVTESLEQQTATSDILRVISSSPSDIQPVFDAIVRTGVGLCEADYGFLARYDGTSMTIVAHFGATQEEIEAVLRVYPMAPTADSLGGRTILERAVVHIPDVRRDPTYGPRVIQDAGWRTGLGVPLLRDGAAVGLVGMWRRDVRPFSGRQIALLQTFADQAVIAIENVRLFKELAVANRELAAASQHKSEFLANMSHELRTPLNAIIGFSEVLTDRMFGDLNEKQDEYLKDIHASGTHLLSLINDILDLSKIEAGRMELELTDFDLLTALDNAVMLVRERAGRRAIALQMTVDAGLGQIQGDERKIRQVVLNLLSNAIKFTPEGGRIEVEAVPRDGSVEVSVSDTGVGIAPEDHEAVFEEFRQVGTAEKKAEGTGLGLTLCRKFIELHGGRIWVKSELGVGSTFTFTIPVRRGA
jgi:signal transduction histidine kinase/putative methionine-R-sulfoxide reductase with GAF domain